MEVVEHFESRPHRRLLSWWKRDKGIQEVREICKAENLAKVQGLVSCQVEVRQKVGKKRTMRKMHCGRWIRR